MSCNICEVNEEYLVNFVDNFVHLTFLVNLYNELNELHEVQIQSLVKFVMNNLSISSC